MLDFDPSFDAEAHELSDEQVAEQVRTEDLRAERDQRDADLGIENRPPHERAQERECYEDFARAVAVLTGD